MLARDVGLNGDRTAHLQNRITLKMSGTVAFGQFLLTLALGMQSCMANPMSRKVLELECYQGLPRL